MASFISPIPLAGKTAFITGASRGIGLAIGKMLAAQGVNVTVAAKTSEPHPKLPGTIHTAVEEIEKIAFENNHSSKALAVQVDIRDAEKVEEAIAKTMERFGNLDIVINNASAISMAPTVETSPKQYDLMNNINARGTWLVSRFALPHLLKSSEQQRNPHILTLSPDLGNNMFNYEPARYRDEVEKSHYPEMWSGVGAAYAMAKVGMSVCSFALAAELEGRVSVNTLWPYTLIGTSAMKLVSPDAAAEERKWRSPDFVAEAAIRILQEDATSRTSQAFSDELYLRARHGWGDEKIKQYSLGGPDVPLDSLAEDLFITTRTRNTLKAVRSDMAGQEEGYRPNMKMVRQSMRTPRPQRDGGGSGGGFQRREMGFKPRDGGFQRRDGDFQPRAPREGGYQRREGGAGGYQPRDGGFKPREGGFQRREGGYQRREGGYGQSRTTEEE